MLDWSDGQKYALRALGYRRWLLRSSLGELRETGAPQALQLKPEATGEQATALSSVLTELVQPAPAQPAAAPSESAQSALTPSPSQRAAEPALSQALAPEPQLIRWNFGQLRLDDNYCLISSVNLRYQWLLPPPIWEEGQWRLLRRAEADLLLRALINSGEAAEGRGLETFLQASLPAPLPISQPLDLRAKTVALGNFVAKNLGQEQRLRVYYLSHPQFVLEQRAKRQLWQQIKGLKDY